MNILMLLGTGKASDSVGVSRRIHYDFMLKMRRHNNFFIYGPGKYDKKIAPLKYEKTIKFSRLQRHFTPDLVIAYSKFCCEKWLPIGFPDAHVPKVCIEVDYWNIGNRRVMKWYEDNGFLFIIQRGYYKKSILPAVWLPFSASRDFLSSATIPIEKRVHKIAFVGRGGNIHKNGFYYPIRRAAIKKLCSEKLICNLGVVKEDYIKALSEYSFYLSDSGRFDSPPAKHFEIMASGSILFTTPFSGVKELFSKNKKVCYYYHKDLYDIEEQAEDLLKVPIEKLEEVRSNAVDEIKNKHTDSHRIDELQELLTTYLKHGRFIRRWGI